MLDWGILAWGLGGRETCISDLIVICIVPALTTTVAYMHLSAPLQIARSPSLSRAERIDAALRHVLEEASEPDFVLVACVDDPVGAGGGLEAHPAA